MRVADLDRDLSAVFPSGGDRSSEFLYERMREATDRALAAGPGERVLDAAAGLGNDGHRLASRGLVVTNAEPSQEIGELGKLLAREQQWRALGTRLTAVRAWCERLPFTNGAFRASFCKGSLDHFDDPAAAISELARVTASDGRVVLSVANMDSLACRLLALADCVRRPHHPGRRHRDVPADHYTRYDADLLRRHAGAALELEVWHGMSLFWGIPLWRALLDRLPLGAARRLLRASDRLAHRYPTLADVIVVAGRPRPHASKTSDGGPSEATREAGR